ncbi:hypothetical protein [Bremerella alba]|uniref:hypothetical protein n=1 Tax=Bremerella alba TaxID=980252 RepID=UPI001A955799|nr:hypothetical protein [Bremerella alba]
MYAACLIITSAVLGVDFGYQPTDGGQLEYIIQIEPEAIEKLRSGEAIQVGLPPNVQRVQVFRVQVGDAELPKILPTAYEEPVNEKTNPIGLMPTESPKLTAPPETTSAADSKPTLGEELAQYVPRSTRTLPSGATTPNPTNTPAANNTAASGSGQPPIPGAAERYGGAGSSASRFSVPSTPGSPYNAVQTSGTTPLGSVPTPGTNTTGSSTAGNTAGNPTGSQFGPGSTNTTGNTTPNNGSTATGATNWSAAAQNNGATNNTATNQPNSGTNTTNGASNQYRFNQTTSGNNQSAPDLITPTDTSGWASNNGQNNNGQNNTGSTYGNNQGNTGTGQNNPTGGNASPPNSNYPNNNGSQQPPNYGNLAGNNNSGTDNSWTSGTWNSNQNNGTSAPFSPMPNIPNTGQPPQNNQQPIYNNQQPPANYNNQQQPPYNGNFVNNGYPQPQYNNGQNPNYGYNVQAPYYPQGYPAPQRPVAQVAYNDPAGTAPPVQQQSPTTPKTTDASVSEPAEPKEAKEPARQEGESLPSWWPFLAFGFLLSFCANGYMFIISQDFQRKYQDLLEDVRDLRTMSND